MNKDTRFLIVGLGLMGGSYAYALSKRGYHVAGIDINQDSIAPLVLNVKIFGFLLMVTRLFF